MKRLILFLWIHVLCIASSPDEEDPMHYYHVNVITGHLDLSFQDALIKAPFPYPITRSYSSAGALERTPKDLDLYLKSLRGSEWMFQGGWSFLPHANILECMTKKGDRLFYVSDPGNSHLVKYKLHHEKKGAKYYYPKGKNTKTSGSVSRRQNPSITHLKAKRFEAKLCLPDGGKRYYAKVCRSDLRSQEVFWRLTLEVLPSGHRIQYEYERLPYHTSQLARVQLQNPSGTKTFATLEFDQSSFEEERTLSIKSSDGQFVQYQMAPEHEERTYLGSAQTSIRPPEAFHHQPGRKGKGARLGSFNIGSNAQMGVSYHLPRTTSDERKWVTKNPKKHKRYDRVESIQLPDLETGELTHFATFTYHKNCTEVWDYEGLLTRYHHNGERLSKIEYLDKDLTLRSSVEFKWEENNLISKTLLDEKGEQVYCKSFIYNSRGDVVEEKWEDISRQFSYTDKHLLKYEKDCSGLEHYYEYFRDTDLISKKITLFKGKILKRELSFYDEDHLLEKTIIDDGAKYAQILSYTRHPETGLIETETLSFCDETPAVTRTYRYNEKREPIEETLTAGNISYTLYMQYDACGRIIEKTTPLGRKNLYVYNDQGNLSRVKEVGQSEKIFEYDALNQPIRCIQNGKVTQSRYDRKGRAVERIDPLGNQIQQDYDSFGHLETTYLPKALNEQGQPYTPIIKTTSDRNGNIATSTNPKGETTTTEYNLLRKPVKEQYPDGSIVTHRYNQDGTLAETTESDGTKICYCYDPFQRMTSKCILKDDLLLSKETWRYNTFHLQSYTNPLGLTTHYIYDKQGRKIREEAGSRSIHYAYDALGNVERITQGEITKVQLHNIEGEVVETWEEDTRGKIENRMLFFYDDEGRKIKAIRTTENGDVEDHFHYDQEGHLCTHIDPYGAKTTITYSTTQNTLRQTVETKTTTDPLGNSQIETYDAHGRLAKVEKTDPMGQFVAKEEILYDLAGNKAKRITTIFDQNTPIRTHTTCWEYNKRGLPIAEIEEGEKRTEYAYNSRGWLTHKKLPSGITLTYTYDPLGRLTNLRSSDSRLHYSYTYDQGDQPTEAKDHIRNLTWKRTYNLFGELTSETTPHGATSIWEYDHSGRCIEHHLPDQSSIVSLYEGLHLNTIERHSPTGSFLYSHTYTRFDANGHVAEEELIHHLGKNMTLHDLLERPKAFITPWHTATIDYGPSGLIERINNTLFQIKEYQYDPLSQLIQEGTQTHQFDSLGNPLDATVNHLNQITSTTQSFLRYDQNGNPNRKQKGSNTHLYEYDPLDRLTIFQHGDHLRLQFTYDPFFRLYSKVTYTTDAPLEKWDRKVNYYLYDKDLEIGLLDEKNTIQELKVLGLGIRGDIGAAVAIELQSQVYAPLHDFQGNIIALATTKGTLTEICDMDAFGKATLTPSKNPWRFQSKRSEDCLIFFGLRFYDPDLGRWLTPDPAGSVESPNLYLYARNSPLNRLDLFGLLSEDGTFRTRAVAYHVDGSTSYALFQSQQNDMQIDYVVCSTSLHKLGFSPENLPSNNIIIQDIFNACLPKDATGLALYSLQTGVGVTGEDLIRDVSILASEVPGDCLKIFITTPTNGRFSDVLDTMGEKRGAETKAVAITRQLLTHFQESLVNISPALYWMHVPHSRGAVAGIRALEGMDGTKKDWLREHLLVTSLGAAEPMAKALAKEAVNYYSDLDKVTGRFGRSFDEKQKKAGLDIYDIRFVECISPSDQRIPLLGDHYLMGPTYTKVRTSSIEDLGKKYGFYRQNR